MYKDSISACIKVSDVCMYLHRFNAQTLSSVDLEGIFTFCVWMLTNPALIHSPHLRAKFGDVLYMVFLPPEERMEEGNPPPPSHVMYTRLLLTHPEAQKSLAPSLLLLYGDVEHTGFYDKLGHRFHIAAILKYLWKSPEHRYVCVCICGCMDLCMYVCTCGDVALDNGKFVYQ